MDKVLFIAISLFFYTSSIFAQEKKEKDGPPYYIKSIFFGGGSYYIDQQQVQELYDFIDDIPDIENMEILIQSHTDNIGSLEYNKRLSQMRSESTFQKLIQKGNLQEEMMLIEDFGEQNPYFDNKTWEGKLKNRRVDVIIRPLVL